MKVVLQRVKKASVTIDNEIVGKIDTGYLLLVGFTNGDDESKLAKAAKKIANLRVFEDENGKMNLNIFQVGGKVLSISQFTLYANTNEGNRPSFVEALHPTFSLPLYKAFNEALRNNGLEVEEGVFGADMKVELLNDGPCTILFEY